MPIKKIKMKIKQSQRKKLEKNPHFSKNDIFDWFDDSKWVGSVSREWSHHSNIIQLHFEKLIVVWLDANSDVNWDHCSTIKEFVEVMILSSPDLSLSLWRFLYLDSIVVLSLTVSVCLSLVCLGREPSHKDGEITRRPQSNLETRTQSRKGQTLRPQDRDRDRSRETHSLALPEQDPSVEGSMSRS